LKRSEAVGLACCCFGWRAGALLFCSPSCPLPPLQRKNSKPLQLRVQSLPVHQEAA